MTLASAARAGAAVCVVCALAAPAAAAPLERRLHSAQIEASSFLWNDWNKFEENYHPNYVGDDDPATAWVEGAPGSGAGQWIRLRVTRLAKTTRVRLHVRDGYQKTAALFAANARAKAVTLKLLPANVTVQATLEDRDGWQDLAIDQPSGELTAVELRVDSVYEGTKYADLCISDIDVFATSETPDNPTLEKSHQRALLAWRAARVAEAKAFASGMPKDLPLAAAYQITEPVERKLTTAFAGSLATMVADAGEDPAFAKDWAAPLALATSVVAELDKLPRAQLAPAPSLELPDLDGIQPLTPFWMFSPFAAPTMNERALRLPMLNTVASLYVDQLRMVDVKSTQTPTAYETAKGACASDADTAWVKRIPVDGQAGAPPVRVVVVGRCRRVQTRSGHYDSRVLEMMIYGADGRIALSIGHMHADGYRWADVDGKAIIASGHALIAEGWPTAIDATARTPPAKP